MKILYMFRSLAVWGGIERILVDKMNLLAENYGQEVYLLTTDQGSHPVPYRLSGGVHHEDLNILFYRQYNYNGLQRLLMAWKMARQYDRLLADRLKKINPDVIICTTADRLGAIVKRKGTTPLLVESHSICLRTIDHGRNWLLRKLYRKSFLRSLAKVDKVVALTKGDAGEWRRYHSQVAVIPNFIHQHEETISAQTSKKAIFVGRFDYQKRAEDAIQIWKLVREKHPDWVLEMYGDGELQQEVCSLASAVGGVEVHQPTEGIFATYQDCCFLISTSLFEPFGLVIPEAMSCGLPVVAFDCPYGPADLIADQKDGFLIQDRDLAAFADRVCELIENEELRLKMGQTAKLSSKRYDAEAVMPLWMQLLSQLVVDEKRISSESDDR